MVKPFWALSELVFFYINMKLFKKKSLQIGSENTIDFLMSKTESTGDVPFSGAKALSFYEKSVYVNKAIEKRADKVGEIEFILKDAKGEKIEEHDILNLLAKPNSFQTGEQFFNLWQKYVDLIGEAYILILKSNEFLDKTRKIELRHLDPLKCEPEFNKLGELVSIKYNGKAKAYDAEDIIYDYRVNPVKAQRGVSLLRAGANMIETSIELDRLNYKLVKSGGKVDGIINFKSEQITKIQIEEFKKRYKEELEDMADYGNLIFLGGDANYQRVNLTPNEIGYLDTKKLSLNDICILTDVPKILINSVDEVKYDNADASLKVFLTETIKPQMRQKVSKLNEKVELIPEKFELDFVDPSPEDQEIKLKINESGGKHRYLTINEMRENVNKEEIEGGDEIPKPAARERLEDDEEVKKKDFKHPLRNKEFRRVYFKKRILEQDKYEAEFKRVLNKYLKGQKERILEGFKKSKNIMDENFNQALEIEIGKEMLKPLLKKYMKKSGQEATGLVGGKEFVWGAELEGALDKRADFFLDSMNKTTYKRVSRTLAEGVEQGEGGRDLIKRIDGYFEETYKNRTKTIARTEVHNAVQESTLEGYRQSGMQIKIYVAVLDELTRDEHADMDGEEQPINMPYSSGEMYPGEHSINCRCQH